MTPDTTQESLAPYIQAFRLGDAEAGDYLGRILMEPLRREVGQIIGVDNTDQDDVVQDSIMASLNYLGQDRPFEGDFLRLAVTIARNRCRDLMRHRTRYPKTDITPMADWIADPQDNVLQDMEVQEKKSLLQLALKNIGEKCRKLLQDIYINEIDTETIRHRLGLKSVQAVYYRRTACLDEVKSFLQSGALNRSQRGTYDNPFMNRPSPGVDL